LFHEGAEPGNTKKAQEVSRLESFFAWFAYFAVTILQISSAPSWFFARGFFPLASGGNLNDNMMVDLKMSRFQR
jgi:hypothetical protein